MRNLAITGCGVVCSAGVGCEAVRRSFAATDGGCCSRDAAQLYQRPAPTGRGRLLANFDIRKLSGRQGTSFDDRCSGLAVVASGLALEDSGLSVSDENRHRVGLVLGTNSGSLKSMGDFSPNTLLDDLPYLVNPGLFPNTVINCATGESASRCGLRGIHTTIAHGELAMLSALRYAGTSIRHDYADAMLVGTVEELTPHRAWAAHLTNGSGAATGEGAAVFVMEDADAVRRAGRHCDLEVLSIVMGHRPGGRARDRSAALKDIVRRAIALAEITPHQLSLVTTGQSGNADADQLEEDALAAVCRVADVQKVCVKKAVGQGGAASGGLQLAVLLTLYRDHPDWHGYYSLITERTKEGGIGACVLRGWSRDSASPDDSLAVER